MKTRETEAIQNEIDEQVGQISFEIETAMESCKILRDYITENLIHTPQRWELRRTAETCRRILDTLTDTIGNAPLS